MQRRLPWFVAAMLCWLGTHRAAIAAPASTPANNAFEIPAWAFDRGNAKTFKDQWADAAPMVAYGGQSPILVEYDIDFPASGNYAVSLNFAAADARPVDLLLDGKAVASGCRSATGSWNTSGARWEEAAQLYIPAGKHTMRLQREGAFPHVVGLRFVSEAIPPGFVLHRPGARKLDDPPPAPIFIPYEPEVSIAALRLALNDLVSEFGSRYAKGSEFLDRLGELEKRLQYPDNQSSARKELTALQYEALVEANPWLDFDRLLLVKRNDQGRDLGLPRNWESNSSLPKNGYDDSISLLELKEKESAVTTLFKTEHDLFLGDVDLHWDAKRLLYSSVGANGRWQVFELQFDKIPGPSFRASDPRPLTGEQPDVDSYDACYLPDDRIIFTSTAPFVGVPCVYGSSHVANLFLMDGNGQNIRQLCFDQEHNWCPTVLNNGRVLYTRWEYADTPHSNTRLLFHMNPDGTGQMEFLGSNSYWPNSFFYARPIPGHSSKVVAVIGGHHDNPRMGELVIFDPAQGRHEASPVVQRIPGHGEPVEAIIKDGLTLSSWPKFLHPYPLNEKYLLVSCKPSPNAPWGIYLADVFDNLVPIKQLPNYALFEPIPFRPSPRPPVIPDKVDLNRRDAIVVLQDVYAGDGLKGAPRGTVKALRLFTYHFAYQNMGGLLGVVGMDGPWDIKRVLGTVPVNADGSAKFRVPANLPIAIQPLDEEGKAMQLMRSWFTAMPGEVVQCTGCHEKQNAAPPALNALALNQPPHDIKPWYGPLRGFSYSREVQPVIDQHCVQCHNGQPQPDGSQISNLRGDVRLTNWSSVTPGNGGGHAGKFSVGYAELHRYVRRNGIEGDYHVLEPMEFHADTTDLVQLLKQGHYDVQLDDESWDRLITWIDLNCPYHGTWGEEIDNPGKQRERRRDLLKLYANVDDDPEEVIPNSEIQNPTEEPLRKSAVRSAAGSIKGFSSDAASNLDPPDSDSRWAFDAAAAKRRQADAGPITRRTLDLGEGNSLQLVLIPAGEFLMTRSPEIQPNQAPTRVRIKKPFWMAVKETDNRIYSLFDTAHDSRVEDKNTYQFGIHGYPVNQPEQPVVRVSWNEATAFCRWLSAKTGERFALPSEAQWEWACRAGTTTPFNFGDFESDFSKHANLADAKLSEFASDPYTIDVPLKNPTPFDDWIPKDSRFNDGALITVAPGRYLPNAWGLCDMHGNAAEWTRDNGSDGTQRKVVRGGSWRDIPRRATSSFRLSYQAWQGVYNVSFRVISEGTAGMAMNAIPSAGQRGLFQEPRNDP